MDPTFREQLEASRERIRANDPEQKRPNEGLAAAAAVLVLIVVCAIGLGLVYELVVHAWKLLLIMAGVVLVGLAYHAVTGRKL